MRRLVRIVPLWLFFLAVAAFGCFRVIDTDVWLYIRAGEYITQNLNVPRADIFSYTAGGQPWIDVHWLAQLLLYAVYALSGSAGLSLLRMILVLAIFAVLYRCCRRSAGCVTTLVVLTVSLLTANERFLIKPSLLSLVLGVLFLFFLERSRVQPGRHLYILVPLQILWTNSHPSFLLGPFLIFTYLMDAVITQDRGSGQLIKHLALVLGIAVVSCLLNPYGFSLLLQPWRQMSATIFREHIIPWKPSTAAFPALYSVLSFRLMLVACVISIVLNARRMRPAHLIVTAVFGYLGLRSQRMMAVFALLSAPGLAYNLGAVADTVRYRWPSGERILRGAALILVSVLLIYLLRDVTTNAFYESQRSLRRFGLGKSRIAYPEEAFAFIDASRVKGNIFSNYDCGSYFAGYFFPGRKVFIDGRNLVYGKELFKLYLDAMSDVALMDEMADRFDIAAIVLTHGARDAKALLPRLWKDRTWRPVYIDDRAVVFFRDTPNVTLPRINLEDCGLKGVPSITKFPLAEMRAGEVFFTLGRYDCARKQFLSARRRYPVLPEAYNFLGIIALREGDRPTAKDYFQKACRVSRSYAEPHINLAILLIDENDIAAAEREAKTAIGIEPSNAHAHSSLGLAYTRKGTLSDAAGEFRTAIAIEPGEAEYHNTLGTIYEADGDLRKALAAYEKARELKKDYLAPRFNLGRLYTRLNNGEEAIRMYREALSIDPFHDGSMRNLAALLARGPGKVNPD
jgi:tetratricopeptide (TPR) repeat protein